MKQLLILAIMKLMNPVFSQQPASPVYPRVLTYMSIAHPIFTAFRDHTVFNFKESYTVGFPTGINILRSDHFGFSFEVIPFIKSESGVAKVSNLAIQPGLMTRFKNRWAVATRMAFETIGRFGMNIVPSKTILLTKPNNLFIAMPIPIRFGNGIGSSIGLTFQVGMTF